MERRRKNSRLKTPLLVLIAGVWLFMAGVAEAAFNTRMAVQGYLKSGVSALASGSYGMKIIVRNAGAPVWTKTFVGGSKVTVVTGLFNQILSGNDDASVPLTSALFSVTGASDAITVDVMVDMNDDGTFDGSDAVFANMDIVPVPLAMLAERAEFANSISQLGATAGQILQWNGSAWGPVAMPSATVGPNSVGASHIQADAISNSHINSSAAIAYSKLNLANSITGADISTGAAIPYSKLSLGGNITNSDISGAAGIQYSKLSLGNSIVNNDISSSAAIAYSKLNLGGNIVNADISGAAAIDYSKLNLNSSIVSGDIADAAVTSTKLANNSVALNSSVVTGQLPLNRGGTGATLVAVPGGVAYSGASALAFSAAGAAGQILKSNGTSAPSFENLNITDIKSSVSGNFLTGSSCGAGEALIYAAGTDSVYCSAITSSLGAGVVMNSHVNASAAIAYSKLNLTGGIVNNDINASAGIVYSKLNLGGNIVNADINASAGITYSKLDLGGNIVNADINASAAIDYSKLNLNNSIVANDLTAGSVTAAKLATNAVDLSGATVTNSLPLAKGGTGATTAANARTNLGLGNADNVTHASVTTTANASVGGDLDVTGTGTFTGAITASAGVLGTSREAVVQTTFTTGGSSTAYTITTTPAFSPAEGDRISIRFHVASGASPTLNVNGAGAAAIISDVTNAAPVAGSILANEYTTAVFDGTNWLVRLTPLYGSGAVTAGCPTTANTTGECTTNIAVSGAQTGMLALCSPTVSLPSSTHYVYSSARVSSAGNVRVTVGCNRGSNACTWASTNFACTVVR